MTIQFIFRYNHEAESCGEDEASTPMFHSFSTASPRHSIASLDPTQLPQVQLAFRNNMPFVKMKFLATWKCLLHTAYDCKSFLYAKCEHWKIKMPQSSILSYNSFLFFFKSTNVSISVRPAFDFSSECGNKFWRPCDCHRKTEKDILDCDTVQRRSCLRGFAREWMSYSFGKFDFIFIENTMVDFWALYILSRIFSLSENFCSNWNK